MIFAINVLSLQTILQAKYARIIRGIADKRKIPLEEAMDGFYHSQTFQLVDKGVADLHCRSDIYLIDEYCLEAEENKKLTTSANK